MAVRSCRVTIEDYDGVSHTVAVTVATLFDLLESRGAGYPRIVIGGELWRYFRTALANFQAQTTLVGQTIAAITERMMGVIATDGDGNRILDDLDGTTVAHAGTGRALKDV